MNHSDSITKGQAKRKMTRNDHTLHYTHQTCSAKLPTSSTCSKFAQAGVHLFVRLAEVVKRQFLLGNRMSEALAVEVAANIQQNLEAGKSQTEKSAQRNQHRGYMQTAHDMCFNPKTNRALCRTSSSIGHRAFRSEKNREGNSSSS